MTKLTKVFNILAVGILFDMVTTYIFINYFPQLNEANVFVSWLKSFHPFAVFLYIPVVLIVTALFYKVCKRYKLENEARAAVLVASLTFYSAGLMNIVSMVTIK